jgi:hypothetical protein
VNSNGGWCAYCKTWTIVTAMCRCSMDRDSFKRANDHAKHAAATRCCARERPCA